MLCNDFTGPARFRLNMPEVGPRTETSLTPLI